MSTLWDKYRSAIYANCMLPEYTQKGLSYWRDYLFATLMLWLLPLLLIVVIPGIIMSAKSGFLFLIVYDLFAIAVILISAFLPGKNVFWRKITFSVLLYGLALLLLFYLGSFGPGLIYLFAVTFFAVLILPKKYGYATAVINTVVCILFGIAIYTGFSPDMMQAEHTIGTWIAVSSNLVFLSFMIAIMVPVLFNGLESTIEEQERLRSDLRKKQKDLEFSLDELKMKNAELENFTYVVSHDLREPLRMVTRFMTQLEKKYGDRLDDKAHQYIYFARDGADRMKQILSDLLNYSRAGQWTGKTDRVDLNQICSETKKMLCKASVEKDTEIKWDRLPVIESYRTPIQQVFQNLIENSIKYSRKGVPPEILITSQQMEDGYLIIVKDNGIGIKPDYFEKVFIIFQRLHTQHEVKGSGVGLSVCRKIVESLGGKIWIENTDREGTEFRFTLYNFPRN
ncbi:MAG: GHKL domain-containing protein [Balneolaceae bacterium]|nr:GHKL domain-containing protein [Balneolaceae bacterium]MCH8547361.1 hypothetical protein [Balneolaceae bacterium]